MSGSRLPALEIIAIANEELTSAADSYKLSRQLQALTFFASIASIFINGSYTYVPALAALVTQTLSWTLRLRAGGYHAAGDEGRMRGLLMDAFGGASERIDLTNWLNQISPQVQDRASGSVDPDYFASNANIGLRRLCEHLQENAFWGKCLYKAAATRYLRFLIAFVCAAVLAILIAIPLAPDSGNVILARGLVTILAFGAGLTQANEIMAWRSAESKIEGVDRRLDVLVGNSDAQLKSVRIEALFAVYGDYCIATAAAPPVPSWIYKRERTRLNRIWRERLNKTP